MLCGPTCSLTIFYKNDWVIAVLVFVPPNNCGTFFLVQITFMVMLVVLKTFKGVLFGVLLLFLLCHVFFLSEMLLPRSIYSQLSLVILIGYLNWVSTKHLPCSSRLGIIVSYLSMYGSNVPPKWKTSNMASNNSCLMFWNSG